MITSRKGAKALSSFHMTENMLAKEVVDAAYHIHSTLGPGLLESVYENVLAYASDESSFGIIDQFWFRTY